MKQTQDENRFVGIVKLLARGIRHLLLHNGWFKLFAILLSVILWAGLISQDPNLTREKTFKNVMVTVSGNDTKTNQDTGFIVTSGLEELHNGVNVVAAVPQLQYEEAQASAYNIRVDLSSIKSSGEQEIRILSNSSSKFGQIMSITPSTIKVNVDEYIVRNRIPVKIEVSGEIPEGWYMSTPSADPTLLTVRGPASIVKDIYRGKAFLDMSTIEWEEGTMLISAEVEMFNQGGEVMDSSQLTIITSDGTIIDRVLIEASILPTKTFDVEDIIQVIGEPAEGYEIRTNVSPEYITIAAKSSVLEQLDELPMERTVNVSGLTENTTFALKVRKPSDEAVLSNDTVTVIVEVVPVTEEDT